MPCGYKKVAKHRALIVAMSLFFPSSVLANLNFQNLIKSQCTDPPHSSNCQDFAWVPFLENHTTKAHSHFSYWLDYWRSKATGQTVSWNPSWRSWWFSERYESHFSALCFLSNPPVFLRPNTFYWRQLSPQFSCICIDASTANREY